VSYTEEQQAKDMARAKEMATLTPKKLKKMRITLDINDDWFKKFQTLALAGNASALALLFASFKSNINEAAISQVRRNIDLFIPFGLGVLSAATATYMAAKINAIVKSKTLQRDMLKDGGPLDELNNKHIADMEKQIADMKKKFPTASQNNTEFDADDFKKRMRSAVKPISDELNKRHIKASNWVFRLVKLSVFFFLIGLIYIGFGDSFLEWFKLVLSD